MKKPNHDMQAILDAHKALGPLPITELTPGQARLIPLLDRAAAAYYGQHFSKRALAPMPLPVGNVRHIQIPGGDGGILARVYTPKGEMPEAGWPVIVYYHGGGWVIANLDTYDGSARALCAETEAVVVSVHYRQAPEHKWPAAPQDAYAAYRWVCDNAALVQGDETRIAVAGESAGGNLAAVVCLMARDRNEPLPLHQLLVYPVTDLAHGMQSPSAIENADAAPLNTPMLGWFYDHYLPATADRQDAYISPLHASLRGLPPATIVLAEIDPLRSEGEGYADRLIASGIYVNVKTYAGVTHEFFGLGGLVSAAQEAMSYAAARLRNSFYGVPATAGEPVVPGITV